VPTTVVIADDHQVVRDGLKSMLAAWAADAHRDVVVVAEASNGLEAIRHAKSFKPTLLLLDVAMPYAQGIEVFVEVRRWSPDTRIVALTGLTSAPLLKHLVDAGIDAVFLKGGDLSQLALALDDVTRGERVIAADVVQAIASAEATPQLTRRELEILSLVAAGRSNAEIARALSISANTVNNHRASIMSKLNVHSMAELLAYALRHGLLDSAQQL
jgi:DNA-binding NarL/FixJ family response regulator